MNVYDNLNAKLYGCRLFGLNPMGTWLYCQQFTFDKDSLLGLPSLSSVKRIGTDNQIAPNKSGWTWMRRSLRCQRYPISSRSSITTVDAFVSCRRRGC
jgi:hypothetical protein